MGSRKAPRAYDNSRRAAQADATTQRIADAVLDLLADPVTELSVAEVAAAAGVSAPTVYKYFPNREAMFAGAQDRAFVRLGVPPSPKSVDELRSLVPRLHAFYAEHEPIVRAVELRPALRGMRDEVHRRRDAGLQRVLAPLLAHLSEDDARATCAMLVRIAAVESWIELRDRWGVPAESVTRAAHWALNALLDQMVADAAAHGASARARGSPKRGR
jgi:AcrR family transcriptional regulator